ncbi:hypothetical protein VTO42DRAFT_8779 [Malbranchea cinnamomea]
MAPPAKPRPYRRILTSTLHRRFVHASAIAMLACYIVSFLIGVKTSFFWSWFPLGLCGLRALLLSFSSLVIFVLRAGEMHIGSRTTSTPFQSLCQAVFSVSTLQIFGWYLFSAWWFSEIYMWSASEGAQLSWVKPGKYYERAELNERPIYLRCYYWLLAIAQSIIHVYYDMDQIPIPVVKPDTNATDRRTHPLEPLGVQIRNSLSKIAYDSVFRSSVAALAGPFIYMFFLRQKAWSWTLYFAKLFWDFPRSAEHPTSLIPPLHFGLLLRSLTSGALLVAIWETSNVLFSIFLGQAPLRRNQPLTNGTKDPNGSLINGLNSNKEVVKTYALWELSLIGQQFPDRRKEIFNDIDREGGAAWSQILNATTSVIKGISSRINEFQTPPATVSPPAASTPVSKDSGETTGGKPKLEALPRLSSPPKQEDIFLASPKPTTRPEKFEATLGTFAKAYGQAPDWTPAAKARARDLFDRASSAVLTPSQKQRLSSSAHELRLLTRGATSDPSSSKESRPPHPILEQFIRSPIGWLFRQPYERRLRRIVLGSPYSGVACIVDAINALTRFLIASLTEDQFGKVHSDVSGVIKLFTETITILEGFTSEDGLPVHWTDVDFPSDNADPEIRRVARKVEQVEIILGTMKTGLTELLTAFRPYLTEVGVTGKDLRLAREAAGIVEGSNGVIS